MRNSVDVLVIGAGIAGAAAARELATRGLRVLVVSRGAGIGEATPAAAGMLAAQIEAPDDLLLPLAVAARVRHAALAAELGAAGYDVGYHADGIVQIALDRGGADTLQAIESFQLSYGLDARYLARQDLAGELPGVSHNAEGALVTGDARVNNVALGKAVMRDAVKRGAMTEFAAVEQLLVEKGAVRGAITSAGERRAAMVLIAAGAWSPRIPGLPRPLPIEPVRGQILRMAWPEGVTRRVLFGPAGYAVPRGDDALLGSTMEQVGFDPGTTPDGLASIRAAVAAFAPRFAEGEVLSSWSGLRPMTPDGNPILGADPDVSGLFYCCGHGRNGILLGPITGEAVAAQMAGGESPHDLHPYGVARFA